MTNVLASVPWGKRGGFRTLGGHFFRLFFERGSSSEAFSGCPPWEGGEGVSGGVNPGCLGGQFRSSDRGGSEVNRELLLMYTCELD